MKTHTAKNMPFIIAIISAVTATVLICVSAVILSPRVINFCASYYFICYRTEVNAVSASSISNAVSSYGGAGYILNYGDKYYVTVACYYNQNDAQTVLFSLSRRGLDCTILAVETDEYKINSFNLKNSALYLGNLNTLDELSRLAYDCANGLDTGKYSQSEAENILSDVFSALNGLKNANVDNCFSQSIDLLITLCENAADGYVYSKDVRNLQIAAIDTIICAELY